MPRIDDEVVAKKRSSGKGPAIKSLVPYYGSNRMLAHEVGEALKGCRWVGIPFMGSLPEVLYIGAQTIVCNDRHEHLVNLATVAADPHLGPKLWRAVRRRAFHPLVLRGAQQRCQTLEGLSHPFDPNSPNLAWAIDYWICAWMGRSGEAGKDAEFRTKLATRWNAGGGDSVVRYQNAGRGLRAWRSILSRCTFSCLDAFDFLAKCKDEERSAIYNDPPFPWPGDEYKVQFGLAQQERLATVLTRYQKARIVCRFYDHDLIRRLYPEKNGWEWRRFAGRKQTNEEAPELLLVRN